MVQGKVYINDDLTGTVLSGVDISSFLGGNYVYAAVYTVGHKPIWLGRCLHYALLSYAHLYGVIPLLDQERISERISELLRRSHLPPTGNVVNVYFVPPAGVTGQPDIVIAHDRTTIYHGYEVRSIRPKAAIVNYEIPFSGHRTAVSLTSSRYMEGYALREGAGIPVRANRTGNIVSSGDYPVLAVKNGTAITSSAENGAAESVEYDIMRLSCELAGINLTIGDIMVAEMNAIEELMVFGPEGITSVLSCSGHYYYNLVCDRIEQVLPRINKAFHAKYGNTL